MAGPNGGILGVAAVAMSLDWLQQDLRNAALPSDSIAVIADRNGVILARTRDPERFVGQPLPEAAMQLLRRQVAGTVETVSQLDGIRRVVAYIPPAEGPGGLFLSVGLESDPLVGDYVAADRRAAIMIVGSLLLTFLFALFAFQRTIDRPMQRLLAAAQRWGRQEWQARVGSLGGTREFVRLAEAFDSMAEAVQAREAARLLASIRLAAMQEVAPQVVLTADAGGGVDWANPYWRELTGQDEAASRGDGWLAAIHPEDRAAVQEAWRRVVADAAAGRAAIFDVEARVCRDTDDNWRWFLLRGAAVREPEGPLRALTAVGVDIHDLRKTREELATIAARLQATYDNAPVGLCMFDRELRYIAVNETLARGNGRPAQEHIGRTMEEMAPHVAAAVAPVLRQTIQTGKPVTDFEVTTVEGERRTRLCNLFPVRDAAGAVVAVSAAVIDITARRRAEESERLLSREVDHRAQNALSVVRGLVRLSAVDAPADVPTLVAVIEGRIAAMARAHEVLSREKWVAADLRDLVTQELEPYRNFTMIEGSRLRLRAEAAQPFTLMLHELVANAVKYGALSRPEGRIAIRWSLDGDTLAIRWEETGGPAILEAPKHEGFGSHLIAANLRAQLGGTIERDWRTTGLACDIRLAADVVVAGRRAIAGLPPAANALAGRRVLLAHDDAAASAPLTNALRAASCEVIGPARTVEALRALLTDGGAVDAAIIPATLDGKSLQPLAELLRRRAAVVLHLSEGPMAGDGADAALSLPPGAEPGAVIATLLRALPSAAAP
jgi:PAS domain S-box-containing protein